MGFFSFIFGIILASLLIIFFPEIKYYSVEWGLRDYLVSWLQSWPWYNWQFFMNNSNYMPPKEWVWDKENGGKFSKINRPFSGSIFDKKLPIGKHNLQLYSQGTPNGVKVTILLEELLEIGINEAEYDAWLVEIGKGEQFSSGFVEINPNSKIPALIDYSENKPVNVFESVLLAKFETIANSFQDIRKAKIPAEAIPDFDKGNSICQNACNLVQPSVIATSDIAFGIWRKKPSVNQTVNGTFNATKTIIIPRWVSIRPIFENNMKIGKLREIPGIALVNIIKKK